jgi:hypothetical protein
MEEIDITQGRITRGEDRAGNQEADKLVTLGLRMHGSPSTGGGGFEQVA